MGYWAKPRVPREQLLMFHPTLDAMIDEDHPARLFDEILSGMDWAEWEAQYDGRMGQPPIHPKVVASVLLYGYSLGFRSSRKLEWACTACVDFMWLAQGRIIDHSSFCDFRTRFKKALKQLFRQVGEVAMSVGLIRLNQVGLDGTRVQADSSRHGTRSVGSLEQRLAALDAEIGSMFAEAEATDRQEDDVYGEQTPRKLPRKLADAQRRRELLQRALEAAQAQQAQGKSGAKVPVADPDSAVLQNKDGGFAPNYTAMAAVDAERGYIVDQDVHNEANESHTTVETLGRMERDLGEKPKQFLADSAHATGPNLAELDARGVEGYIPLEANAGPTQNPAERAEPTRPVAPAEWDRLPQNAKTRKLEKTAFVYDATADCYYCPMGRKLAYHGRMRQKRRGREVHYRRYQCVSCDDCPLAQRCRGGAGARSVSHDEYEGQRRAMRARLKTPEGQAVYARRRWICETPFGFLKTWMGVRRFLLRGLAKVQTEWCWCCTAFNLRKLAADVLRLRREFGTLAW